MTKAEADRDQERRKAGKAREEAARLQGMVQAMTSQNAELMRAVAGVTGPASPAMPAAGVDDGDGEEDGPVRGCRRKQHLARYALIEAWVGEVLDGQESAD